MIQNPGWSEWCGGGVQLNVGLGRWNTLMFGSAFSPECAAGGTSCIMRVFERKPCGCQVLLVTLVLQSE